MQFQLIYFINNLFLNNKWFTTLICSYYSIILLFIKKLICKQNVFVYQTNFKHLGTSLYQRDFKLEELKIYILVKGAQTFD